MKTVIIFCCILLLSGCGRHHTTYRSPLRKATYQMPTIVVSDAHSPHRYARTSNHYKKEPIFTVFDPTLFREHQIPTDGIATTDGSPLISKAVIDQLLTDILHALRDHQSLPHCQVIRDANFNYTTLCGLLILKLSDYPLIIKIFKETAESFVLPFSKGFEPTTFFFMCGGSNRHVAGLTRIPNRLRMLSYIEAHEYWKEIASIPRKWYWTPERIEWLHIDGYHIEGKRHIHTDIPATYVIVADFITAENPTPLTEEEQKRLIIDLSSICALHLDPHMKNFIITQKTDTKKPLITIIDTEDQSCMTGLQTPATYHTHNEWYTLLISKFLKNVLFDIKQEPLGEHYFS